MPVLHVISGPDSSWLQFHSSWVRLGTMKRFEAFEQNQLYFTVLNHQCLGIDPFCYWKAFLLEDLGFVSRLELFLCAPKWINLIPNDRIAVGKIMRSHKYSFGRQTIDEKQGYFCPQTYFWWPLRGGDVSRCVRKLDQRELFFMCVFVRPVKGQTQEQNDASEEIQRR